MSQLVSSTVQEEYEDDFEKDLDWLIGEEQGPDYDDVIEAEIDKELEEVEDEEEERGKKGKKSQKEGKQGSNREEGEVEERWPSPMEPLEYDSDRDSTGKSSPATPPVTPPVTPPPPALDEQPDEEKKYILEKIEQANRELQDQEAPDLTRRRRLHFKDTLVDLVVPPLVYEQNGRSPETGVGRAKEEATESEVSGRLSELKISPREENGGAGGRAAAGSGESSPTGQGGKEGRVLVEKDGKFDLVSLQEVESQGLLPPLAINHSDVSRSSPRAQEPTLTANRIPASPTSPHAIPSSSVQGAEHRHAPRPPAQPRNRPNSASHGQSGSQRRGSKRRVRSAAGTPCQATYTLSPQQKELLQKVQEKRERLSREAEQRKREEEEQKRQENELAFHAWLMRKRQQLQGEKRIHRAQEMERMSSRKDPCDPEEAFRSWLHRKQEQQQRERQLEELRRLEQETGYFLHSKDESERAFKLWLKRKRVEKRAEQQASRERSRRLVLEERRARRMDDLMCSVNETNPFRFTEHYRF